MSWSTPFEQPINLPEGKPLITLQDGADYIQRLPKDVSDRPEWQLAIENLIEAAQGRTFRMFARIAVLRALNHGQAPALLQPRKKPAKKYRIIR